MLNNSSVSPMVVSFEINQYHFDNRKYGLIFMRMQVISGKGILKLRHY